MHVHVRCQLLSPADEIAGGRCGEDQAPLGRDFAVGGDLAQRGGTGFCDRTERFFNDVRKAAALVAGRWVGRTVGAAEREIVVVPAHLADQRAGDVGRSATGCQQVHGVPDFGNFAEHHRRPGADEQVCREADRGVAGDAGKRVATSALHADH